VAAFSFALLGEISMSHYVESISRFVVNQAAIDGIVKHLGIALRSPDGSTVAVSDPSEVATIRDGFCAKELGLSREEAENAIQAVSELMKHDTAKCRVTFYYLLADRAGKLDQFV
jgi:hypothetical protein